jgi:hypothetical protein
MHGCVNGERTPTRGATLVDWVEETLKHLPQLRTGPLDTFNDKVFLNEISGCVAKARTGSRC